MSTVATFAQKNPDKPYLVGLHTVLERAAYPWDEIVEHFPPLQRDEAERNEATDDYTLVQRLQSDAPGMHDAMIRWTARLSAKGMDAPTTIAVTRDTLAFASSNQEANSRNGSSAAPNSGAVHASSGFSLSLTSPSLTPPSLSRTMGLLIKSCVAAAQSALGGTLGRLFALSEAYPDLKANQNMMQLTEELTSTENRVAFARQAYNDSVTAYNTYRQSFPPLFFANMFGHTRDAELLEFADSAAIAEAPKVSFS